MLGITMEKVRQGDETIRISPQEVEVEEKLDVLDIDIDKCLAVVTDYYATMYEIVRERDPTYEPIARSKMWMRDG